MITFLAVIHIIACLALVGLVLIQDSKGGGNFTSQSSSSSVLGATGAASFAQTMTKIVAGVFAATCIGLAMLAAHSNKSVVDSMVPAVSAQPATAPATTETPAAAATAAPATTTTPEAAKPAENDKK